jgi:hypothetical protein
MNPITKVTRNESYKKQELSKKQKLILKELDKPMTARELAMKIRKKRINKNCREARNSTKTY